jgi:hypothetical protein
LGALGVTELGARRLAGGIGRVADRCLWAALPARKVPRKRAVHHGRIAFACAVRFALHGVDIALLDMVRLPHQLAIGGILLLGEALPLLPPVRERLEGRPEGRELRRQLRAEGYRR